MQSKSLLIPIAAFAVTAAGLGGFSSQVYARAGLTPTQRAAFEEAYELREEGEREKAREVLQKAGINLETIESLRSAAQEERSHMGDALYDAIKDNNYDAFKVAAESSPLGDIITTKADFKLFVEAHNLHKKGSYNEAKELFDELGLSEKDSALHTHSHLGSF